MGKNRRRDPVLVHFGWRDIADGFTLILYGMVFCIPSLLLFWKIAIHVCGGSRSGAGKRLLLLLFAFPLTLLPLIFVAMILGEEDWADWIVILLPETAYYLIVFSAILLYRMPAPDSESVVNELRRP